MMPSENPLKTARYRLGWTQQVLADHAQIQPVVISNAEQGLYLEPPVAILNALVRATAPAESSTTERDLRTLYSLWVSDARNAHKELLIPSKIPTTFRAYVMDVGPTVYGFCKKLVFDIRTVQFYLDGAERPALFKALSEAVPEKFVAHLRSIPRG